MPYTKRQIQGRGQFGQGLVIYDGSAFYEVERMLNGAGPSFTAKKNVSHSGDDVLIFDLKAGSFEHGNERIGEEGARAVDMRTVSPRMRPVVGRFYNQFTAKYPQVDWVTILQAQQ